LFAGDLSSVQWLSDKRPQRPSASAADGCFVHDIDRWLIKRMLIMRRGQSGSTVITTFPTFCPVSTYRYA
jgi:hypothetical protein